MAPFVTVKTLNPPFDEERVPSTIVPPTELMQEPLIVKLAQLATETARLVPSGTVLPLASLIPENVTVAVPPADKDIEAGPEAVAEVIPGSWIVPIAKLVLVRVAPLGFAATTETPAVCV
jgi:hypothetical protein